MISYTKTPRVYKKCKAMKSFQIVMAASVVVTLSSFADANPTNTTTSDKPYFNATGYVPRTSLEETSIIINDALAELNITCNEMKW